MIAVLCSTYNNENTIQEAVLSVLKTTLPIRMYIVDDGSDIPVSKILPSDERITILRLSKNIGLPKALNKGIDEILKEDFDYIARMDADDISRFLRFEKQLGFMEANPEILLVGCWARYFDEKTNKKIINYCPPTTPKGIKKAMYWNSAICHPTWFMRRAVFDEMNFRYNEQFNSAQDYEFLSRLLKSGQKMANIPEILLDYRVSRQGISLHKRRQQLLNRLKVQLMIFSPTEWRSWAGIAKTLTLFFFPVNILFLLKRKFYRSD